MRNLRAAAFCVVADRVGPGDDDAVVAEAAGAGEAGVEEIPADAFAAMGGGDAGGPEESQAAVVRFVRGEPGDLAILLGVEEDAARGFEGPDRAEGAPHEVEHLRALAVGRWLLAVLGELARLKVLRSHRFGVPALEEESLLPLQHARREVV